MAFTFTCTATHPGVRCLLKLVSFVQRHWDVSVHLPALRNNVSLLRDKRPGRATQANGLRPGFRGQPRSVRNAPRIRTRTALSLASYTGGVPSTMLGAEAPNTANLLAVLNCGKRTGGSRLSAQLGERQWACSKVLQKVYW
ncbi:hypothetical protein SKAU_G00110540 [Synaphobranchus kaupii]|uniref:Uncharacterized protein n=1 Tax=Synaphobranchus kaupii TaxID=118154 RepID=A0A9Q1J8A6_SYNKA|nr:hypothetical protein SKAU_G00110540 [Synaphobranchus kaupii]